MLSESAANAVLQSNDYVRLAPHFARDDSEGGVRWGCANRRFL